MFGFFRRKQKASKSAEGIYHEEMKLAREEFSPFTFTEQYCDVHDRDFLFLDEINNKVGIYQKEKEVVAKKIPFKKLAGLRILENQHEVFSVQPKDMKIGVEENEIALFIHTVDEVVKEGNFYKLSLQINTYDQEEFGITFFDASHPRSDLKKSIREIKRWCKMIATHMLLEHARIQKEKVETKKRKFIALHRKESVHKSKPFYFLDIFRNYDTILNELKQGPFTYVNYHRLKIDTYLNNVLYLRDVEQMYEYTDLHNEWLQIIMQKWGIEEVQVLKANAVSEKISFINNDELSENWRNEFLYLASIYQMEEKLRNAYVSRVKGKRIYIECEDYDVTELTNWWENVKIEYDWISDYLKSFIGKEYEIIFKCKEIQASNDMTSNLIEQYESVENRQISS